MDKWLMAALDNHVPHEFLHDTLRLWFSAYEQAHSECRGMPWEVAHDYRGHRRRAIIEERWPLLASQHGLQSIYRPNRRRSSYFTQIIAGRILITQSYVDGPDTMVRKAEFRKTCARRNTPSLFGDEPTLPTRPLYLILISGESDSKRQPYFLNLVAPDRHCQQYLYTARLFDMFHATVQELTSPPTQQENVLDEVSPELKTISNREGS